MRGVTFEFQIALFQNLYFYSHTSCEVWPLLRNIIIFLLSFLLTHLMRGVTLTHAQITMKNVNFYSHTSCEVWHFLLVLNEVNHWFLLTHLMRGVTTETGLISVRCCISTHTPHARCDRMFSHYRWISCISTHTPHARCDCKLFAYKISSFNFYSHTSCEVWLY